MTITSISIEKWFSEMVFEYFCLIQINIFEEISFYARHAKLNNRRKAKKSISKVGAKKDISNFLRKKI